GVDHFTAIINPPESCIFAVGDIEMQPVWEKDHWEPCPMMSITVSFDHRMIDGAYGARMLARVKELLQAPQLMLC
ncbi:MAG: 2-oxo acid dehydrogenase subunit E2, partial [Oscillospiraceae bacterium]